MVVLRYKKHSVIFVLLVTMLTSTLGWTLNAAISTKDFGHELQVHGLISSPIKDLGQGEANCCDNEAGITAHLSVHAAEHAQFFFFFNNPMQLIGFLGTVVLVTFVLTATIPKRIPASLFRPPRVVFKT